MKWVEVDAQHWEQDLQRIVLSNHDIEKPYSRFYKTKDGYRFVGSFMTLEEAQS